MKFLSSQRLYLWFWEGLRFDPNYVDRSRSHEKNGELKRVYWWTGRPRRGNRYKVDEFGDIIVSECHRDSEERCPRRRKISHDTRLETLFFLGLIDSVLPE
jgi:hypothetical protein